MTLKQKPFDVGLLLCLAFLFNVTINFKATRVTHLSLDLNENFTGLKVTIKNRFLHVFEKEFCHRFYFKRDFEDK